MSSVWRIVRVVPDQPEYACEFLDRDNTWTQNLQRSRDWPNAIQALEWLIKIIGSHRHGWRVIGVQEFRTRRDDVTPCE